MKSKPTTTTNFSLALRKKIITIGPTFSAPSRVLLQAVGVQSCVTVSLALEVIFGHCSLIFSTEIPRSFTVQRNSSPSKEGATQRYDRAERKNLENNLSHSNAIDLVHQLLSSSQLDGESDRHAGELEDVLEGVLGRNVELVVGRMDVWVGILEARLDNEGGRYSDLGPRGLRYQSAVSAGRIVVVRQHEGGRRERRREKRA